MSDQLDESKKRKHDIDNTQEITSNKKRHDSPQSTNDSDIFPFVGCTWSSNNWSCAYIYGFTLELLLFYKRMAIVLFF